MGFGGVRMQKSIYQKLLGLLVSVILISIFTEINIINAEEKFLSWGPAAIGVDIYKKNIGKIYPNGKNLPEINVAVIDTGIDYNHEFLKNRIKRKNFDYSDLDGDALDEQGHGTQIAGIIVDSTFANVKISAYKVADKYGEATINGLISGINQAIKDKVNIINISLVGTESASADSINKINSALKSAISKNIVVVLAAGNDKEAADKLWLTNYGDGLTISSIGKTGQILSDSNYGKVIDFCAPGASIRTTTLNSKYIETNGTSMAAAFVSSAAALTLSLDKSMTPSEVFTYLKNNAIDLGTKGFDKYYGNGKINMSKVVGGNITGVKISNKSIGINLNWKRVLGAKSIVIYRKKSGGKYTKLATIGSKNISYLDKKVNEGTTYKYKVEAKNGKVNSVGYTDNIYRIGKIRFSPSNSKSKTATMKISRNKLVTGYQFMYSSSKNFSNSKTVRIVNNKITICNIKKLIKGKSYYFKVRGYKTKTGTTYFGDWSSVKQLKIKK